MDADSFLRDPAINIRWCRPRLPNASYSWRDSAARGTLFHAGRKFLWSSAARSMTFTKVHRAERMRSKKRDARLGSASASGISVCVRFLAKSLTELAEEASAKFLVSFISRCSVSLAKWRFMGQLSPKKFMTVADTRVTCHFLCLLAASEMRLAASLKLCSCRCIDCIFRTKASPFHSDCVYERP